MVILLEANIHVTWTEKRCTSGSLEADGLKLDDLLKPRVTFAA